MRNKLITFGAAVLLAAGVSAQSPVEYWKFDDVAGQTNNEWVNENTSGNIFNYGGVAGIETDGLGNLVWTLDGQHYRSLPKAGTGTASAIGDVYAVPYTTGKYRIEVDFESWQLDPVTGGRLFFRVRNANVRVAEIRLEMAADDSAAEIQFVARENGIDVYRSFSFNANNLVGVNASIEFDFDNDTIEYFLDGISQAFAADFIESGFDQFQYATDTGWANNTVTINEMGVLSLSAPSADLAVDADTRYQPIEGFGGSAAWYLYQIDSHDLRQDLIDTMFRDLKLDIFRVRNLYNIDAVNAQLTANVAASGKASLASIGLPLKVLCSGWSPPASLKSNGQTANGGTLIDNLGQYDYAGFANWWADSLDYYEGLSPALSFDLVSIQNEPDYVATHDSCILKPVEDATYAGYDKAFDAVWNEFDARRGVGKPLMIGSEHHMVDSMAADYYTQLVNLVAPSKVYGHAHHMYQDRATLVSEMDTFNTYVENNGDKPIFQTEYGVVEATGQWPSIAEQADLMHNSLVVEEVASYFTWSLAWGGTDPDPATLIYLTGDNGGVNGFDILPQYYAFKHYSAFIHDGWQRIDVSGGGLAVSGYISPDNSDLSVVVLNDSSTPVDLPLTITGFNMATGTVWRSSATELCENVGALSAGTTNVTFPADSLTTLSLQASGANQAPFFTSDPIVEINAEEEVAYSSSIADNASDPDGDPMAFSKVSGPTWLSVASDGTLSGTPGTGDIGANVFTVKVEDGDLEFDTATLNITVFAPSGDGWDFQCHTHTHQNLTGLTEAEIRAELEAVDAAFAANNLPEPLHHAYPYGANDAQVQSILAEYRLSGRKAGAGLNNTYPMPNWYAFPICSVYRNDQASTIIGKIDDAIANNAYLHIFTHDVTDNPDLYSTTPAVMEAILDHLTNMVAQGSCDVLPMRDAYDSWNGTKAVITVSFDDNRSSLYNTVWPMFQDRGLIGTAYVWTGQVGNQGYCTWAQIQEMAGLLGGTNNPPVWNSSSWTDDVHATNDVLYTRYINWRASDPDGDTLTYAIVSGPSWLTMTNPDYGYVTGTPAQADVGDNVFTVSVSDGVNPPVEATMTIIVDGANAAPVFTADPINGSDATADAAYSDTINGSATDADGDPLTYSKVSGPAWLSVASDGTLSGTPGAGDVGLNTFIVQVDATGGSDTATLEIMVDMTPGGPIADFAQNESTVLGSVTSGSISDTLSNDDVYEVLTEAQSGGKPSNRRSELDHTWTFNVTGGELVTFYVEAHHDANNEGDDFTFSYSTDNVNFTDMVTVTKTADDNTVQFYSLPSGLSGAVYIKVVDTDRTRGNSATDSLYVDALFITSESSSTPPGSATNPSPTDGAASVSISPTLTWAAGMLASSHDVYFGTAPTPGAGEFQGNQAGTSYAPGSLATLTTYYWRIDEVNGAGTTTGPIWSFTTGAGTPEMHVSSIVLSTQKAGNKYKGRATVTIVDSGSGQPVQGASVSGDFTGAFGESGSATTDSAGVAVITTSAKIPRPFTFTFTVTGVTEAGHDYNAANNVETSKTGSF